MMMEYPKSDFPADMQPEVGLELHMSDNAGNVFPVVIAEVQDEVVILDANHPLAGQDLIFEIELISIA
jgi:peptidylprolyl isomerase